MKQPLQILLVDDHSLFREGIKAVLAAQPGLIVTGEAGDGFEAICLARELKPDIVLMDIGMPRCNGLKAMRQIKRELPGVRVIMLTVSEDDQDLFEAIKCGAQGYLIKDLKAGQLFDALEGVARGEAAFSGVIAARILEEFRHPIHDMPEEALSPEPLSAREIEVLELLVAGRSNREIAHTLVISENTARNHLRSILQKLHLRNRIEAAVYAVREGLVESPHTHEPN